MSWLFSPLIALITAVLGCIGSGVLADRCVRWYRISNFEGASGYFMLGVALLGLIGGFFIGLIVSRVTAAGVEPGFLKGLTWSASVTVATLLVIAAVARLLGDPTPKLQGRPLMLQVELRAPESIPLPAEPTEVTNYRPYLQVETFRRRKEPAAWLEPETVRRENGEWILAGELQLTTSVRRKLLYVFLDTERELYFPLPGRPRQQDLQWSEWMTVSPEVPHGDGVSAYRLRYRLTLIAPPPPPPTAAEVNAAKEAREQAAFKALDPAGPLTLWLPSLQSWVRADHREAATKIVLQRPELVSELSALILGSDAQLASDTLRIVELFPEIGDQLVPVVETAGRDIARRLRAFNSTRPEQDPSYEGAALVAIRFSGWINAVRELRQTQQADFVPQLREILELARLRPDSHALRADVVRVASFYLQEWAQVAPLPSDPAPR